MSSPSRLGFLHGGAFHQLAALADPAVRAWRPREIYLPEARKDDFDGLDTLIVSDRLHPGLLADTAPALLRVAENGGTVVVLGENRITGWLPGLRGHLPAETNFWWWRTGDDNGVRLGHADHPAWAHLSERAVRWHYHGLLEPPEGATPLVHTVLEDEGDPERRQVLLYEDLVSTPGRLIVTTMDPVYHHGSRFMPGATQLLYGLLRWTGAGLPAVLAPTSSRGSS
ncbi:MULTISPECIES: hypothetical protein [unclassified Streptomyces]|uniref:hypothetical protein n=1 Tax=unclassified Streptomyces TaxID=2593676 RepID=UPI00093E721A|nr:hypothetical protein [Streptomyces sp. CB02058]OKI88875.1 hypothetical protein AMK10_31750 [Streptomyces sp. CB02058]